MFCDCWIFIISPYSAAPWILFRWDYNMRLIGFCGYLDPILCGWWGFIIYIESAETRLNYIDLSNGPHILGVHPYLVLLQESISKKKVSRYEIGQCYNVSMFLKKQHYFSMVLHKRSQWAPNKFQKGTIRT